MSSSPRKLKARVVRAIPCQELAYVAMPIYDFDQGPYVLHIDLHRFVGCSNIAALCGVLPYSSRGCAFKVQRILNVSEHCVGSECLSRGTSRPAC